jgi:hypothetical protein
MEGRNMTKVKTRFSWNGIMIIIAGAAVTLAMYAVVTFGLYLSTIAR